MAGPPAAPRRRAVSIPGWRTLPGRRSARRPTGRPARCAGWNAGPARSSKPRTGPMPRRCRRSAPSTGSWSQWRPTIDERLQHAAARPVIVPETIVCDHGMVYMSQTFRSACRAMGINFQPSHPGSPWEKGSVETSFSAVNTLFAQYVAGYVGSSVERRGKDAEQDAAWSMAGLQELLDEWIVAGWQNRPHDGLRHPLTPGKALTPNEKYAALAESAGYVPVPLTAGH